MTIIEISQETLIQQIIFVSSLHDQKKIIEEIEIIEKEQDNNKKYMEKSKKPLKLILDKFNDYINKIKPIETTTKSKNDIENEIESDIENNLKNEYKS